MIIYCKRIIIFGVLLSTGVVSGAENLKNSQPTSAKREANATYTEQEARQMLRVELVEFERYTESTMSSALEILKNRKVSAADYKKIEGWQAALLKRFQTALRQDDPLLALVDVWAVSKSLIRYMEQKGSTGEMSAATVEVWLDMIKRRDEQLAYIASRYLSPEAIASLSHRLDAFTVEQQIAADKDLQPEGSWWSTPFFSVWGKGQSAVEGIFNMSLIPGRALKGVSDSGTALSGIRDTTAEAVQVIEKLPANIRSEFQVALNDLVEKRSEIIEILSAIDSVSTNLRVTAQSTQLTSVDIKDSMTLARELLPAGESFAIAVERAVSASTDLMKVVGQDSTVSTMPGAEGVEERRGFDIAEYQKTAIALTGAANEIRQMLVEIRALVDNPDAEESTDEESEFDVREYGAAADSIQRGTAEIRALISDLRVIAEDDVLRGRLGDLRDEADAIALRSAAHATGVVDHLTLRVIQIAFVVFFLVCGYALLRRKLRNV